MTGRTNHLKCQKAASGIVCGAKISDKTGIRLVPSAKKAVETFQFLQPFYILFVPVI